MARYAPAKGMLSAAFREIKRNPPSVLAETRRKKGEAAAEKQRKAIAINKARRSAGYSHY